MSSIPKTTKAWTVHGTNGFDSLKFNESVPIPEVSDYEVLVKFHAASLNYRDIIIPKGKYPFALADNIVPGSDGAGEVISVGPKVTRFKRGAKVVTLFNQGHLGGSLNPQTYATGLGGRPRRHAPPVRHLQRKRPGRDAGLAQLARSLDALLRRAHGMERAGTGGVSTFAVQFAKAAGAKVIATTSSAKKAEVLRKLGADEVINYKEVAAWGEKAKSLTAGGEGVDHIIEVGGSTTMAQSLKAIKIDGVISIIGFLGGDGEKEPSFLEALIKLCTVRGILVGNRIQFEEMNRAIEINKIKPVVDEKVFALEELKEAYQYMWDQKHFGKLTIKIE
ncbi:Zinc-type alcohol dehydrogenase-like protein [Lachnellula cervina]|uniref:Zinc-type alcohol dehydrogenase-like protein n=1 Tax=Lachnellula cervina TaxID=1316786 RepID=A0A7D8UYH6_9HELO|nr:Zinc-type alcohol dehydrogenase-like protein [Lachnellula cervina]